MSKQQETTRTLLALSIETANLEYATARVSAVVKALAVEYDVQIPQPLTECQNSIE